MPARNVAQKRRRKPRRKELEERRELALLEDRLFGGRRSAIIPFVEAKRYRELRAKYG